MPINYEPLNRMMEMLTRMVGQDYFSKQRLKRTEEMYGRTGEASLGRSMQLAGEQSRLRTGERAESERLTRGRNTIEYDRDVELAMAKTLDIIRQQDPDEYLTGSIQVAKHTNNPKLAEKLKQDAMPDLLKAAQTGITMSEGGKVEPQDVVDKLFVSGGERTDQALRQRGTLESQREQRGVAMRGQDITRRGQDVTTRGQDVTLRGQDITATGQELGKGKDYRVYIKDLRENALAFLDDLLTNYDEYVDSEGRPTDRKAAAAWEAMGKKETEKISKQDIRTIMSKVSATANKSRSGKLSDEDMDLLLGIYNIEDVRGGMLESGEIEEQPLTPEEKRQIYIDGLIQNGINPRKAERMAARKYGF